MNNKELKAEPKAQQSKTAELLPSAPLVANPLLAAANYEEVKMIAEFMGYKFNDYPKLEHNNVTKPNENEWFLASWDLEDFHELCLNNFKYETSFDALMPVCKKLDYLSEQKVIEWSKDFEFWSDKLDHAVTRTYTIQPIYKVVVEFIEWYNSQGVSKGSSLIESKQYQVFGIEICLDFLNSKEYEKSGLTPQQFLSYKKEKLLHPVVIESQTLDF